MRSDFAKIYEHLFDGIYRYVFVKTKTPWDTDDLVSEIFRKAFESYSPRIRNPAAWLFQIAKNTIADFYRKRRELPVGVADEGNGTGGGFERNLESDDEMQTLRGCLALLPPEDSELITLHYFSDMKLKDVAFLLHRSEGSVKMGLMRARNRLRHLMEEKLEG